MLKEVVKKKYNYVEYAGAWFRKDSFPSPADITGPRYKNFKTIMVLLDRPLTSADVKNNINLRNLKFNTDDHFTEVPDEDLGKFYNSSSKETKSYTIKWLRDNNIFFKMFKFSYRSGLTPLKPADFKKVKL